MEALNTPINTHNTSRTRVASMAMAIAAGAALDHRVADSTVIPEHNGRSVLGIARACGHA